MNTLSTTQAEVVLSSYDYALCGSMKDAAAIEAMAEVFRGRGDVVGVPPMNYPGQDSRYLSKLHFQKIRVADNVIIVNPTGRIGPSTFGEICVAMDHDKAIFLLNPPTHDSVGYSELKAWNFPIWTDEL